MKTKRNVLRYLRSQRSRGQRGLHFTRALPAAVCALQSDAGDRDGGLTFRRLGGAPEPMNVPLRAIRDILAMFIQYNGTVQKLVKQAGETQVCFQVLCFAEPRVKKSSSVAISMKGASQLKGTDVWHTGRIPNAGRRG